MDLDGMNMGNSYDGYAMAISEGKLDLDGHPIPPARQLVYHVGLDIGAGVLWCKYCARTECPVFKKKKTKEVLNFIKKQTLKNGQVAIDVYSPESRYIFFVIALSHVGCSSFSYVDVSDEKTECVDKSSDFLEILDDENTEKAKKGRADL